MKGGNDLYTVKHKNPSDTAALLMFGIVGIIAASIPITILRGWIASVLWGWFCVPLGLPVIGTWHAVGLLLLVGMAQGVAKHTSSDSDSPISDAFGNLIGYGIVGPLIALLMGWVIIQFM